MNATFCVWTGYFFDLSFEDAILEFKKNGVDAVELSSEHGAELFARGDDVVATGKTAKEFAKANGMTITQGHLPLRFGIVTQRDELPMLLKYIDMYEAIGIKNMVLHCDRINNSRDLSSEERLRANVESLKVIAEHIKNKDIYICLENLRQPKIYPVKEPLSLGFAEDLLKIIELVGSDRFAICLDTGHLNLVEGNQGDFIRKAGKKLHALHIHDNQNLDDMDQHLLPFSRGTVDFSDVMKALREIDYEGMFNFEIPGEMKAPLPIRLKKLEYVRFIYDFMMNDMN
jgi:sugar phosphate isomerase/epimerase